MTIECESSKRFPVLVLGGYGEFGGRICRLLARDGAMRVFVAGRSQEKAAALVASARRDYPNAAIEPMALDLRTDLTAGLAKSGARLVIHTAGPFQGQDYTVAETCIEHGVHYIDIADGREFVCGFDALDEAATRAGVLAVSGASSVPGLSSTVIERLRPAFRSVEAVNIALVPSSRAATGSAIIGAVLTYLGRPFLRWQDGCWLRVYGWQDSRRIELAGGDFPPVGRRWMGACDVPDNALLPARIPGLRTATFHAGHEVTALYFALLGLSWLVRLRLLPPLQRFTPLFHKAGRLFESFGTGRGGMAVDLKGTAADGRALNRRWTITADRGEGPWIPCLPAVILARKLARGDLTTRGATPCWNLFSLEEFSETARPFAIHVGAAPAPTRAAGEAVA
ncbi:MAG: saccharopine dehydrogenase NADP-binding domain-containing protein [Alphaproteobacteria bacterium]|nr:saccharopine dehydrogenase NADP-binding domain-containing protein [Alphaproteobacteria bacterium]